MAYTDAQEIREYQDIQSGSDDGLLATLAEAAQQAIDNYCRRTFEASADSTRYFDYSPEYVEGYKLHLDADLASITTVTNGDSVVVAASEYTTLPRNETPYYAIRLLSDSGVYWTYDDEWMDAISVTGRWAYSTTAPDDIAQACTQLAAFLYRQRDRPDFDVTAIEAGVVIKASGMPANVRKMLAPYVKP